jgi:hypothetical protein
MEQLAERYTHLLLFECAQCSTAIPVAFPSESRNVEEADGRAFTVRCSCGWAGNLLGALARRHWVETWEPKGNAFTERVILLDDI